MLRNDIFSVSVSTLYLFIYLELLQFENTIRYAAWMLLLSPFLICWMVYTVLKHGKYDGPESDDDIPGYLDKKK